MSWSACELWGRALRPILSGHEKGNTSALDARPDREGNHKVLVRGCESRNKARNRICAFSCRHPHGAPGPSVLLGSADGWVSCQGFSGAFTARPPLRGLRPRLGALRRPRAGQSRQSRRSRGRGKLSPSPSSRSRQGAWFCLRSHAQSRCSVGSCGSPVVGSCLRADCPLPRCRGESGRVGGPRAGSADQPPAVSKLL